MTAPAPDRLFDLLPLVHRWRDAESGNQLRDLLRVIAEQVDVVEQDVASLYDNWFVETADDWAVPYLADLIGWTPVDDAGALSMATGGRDLARNAVLVPRRDVANTLRHRRRKGTRALLEDLAADVTGWPGRAVELYRLLLHTQHVAHLHLERARTTDVRDIEVLERLDGPFDLLAHTVDVRRICSHRTPGRHNIPDVGLFVWRLNSYPVTGAPACQVERVGRWAFTTNALGFDSPLFTAPVAGGRRDHPIGPADVPGPITRAAFEVTDDQGRRAVSPDYYGPGASLEIRVLDRKAGTDWRLLPPEQVIPADLADWDYYRPVPGTVAVDPVLGRMIFPRHHPPKAVKVTYHYGFSADLGGGEYERPILRLPVRPPALAPADREDGPPPWVRKAGDTRALRHAVRDWRKEKPEHAVIELTSSDVYGVRFDAELPSAHSLTIRAASRRRPVLWLSDRRTGLADSLSVALQPGSELILDGLMVAGRAVHLEGVRQPESGAREVPADSVEDQPEEAPASTPDCPGEPCIAPTRVVIRHCTIVPGWAPMAGCEPSAPPPPSLELVDLGEADVQISHSIIGLIQVVGGHDADPVRLAVSDSIVDSTDPQLEALGSGGPGAAYAALSIARATVFGQIHVHAIDLGEDSIFEGVVKVARRGRGCLRFSSVVPGSRTPRRFHCQPDRAVEALGPAGSVPAEQREEAERRVRPRFTSTRYPDPGYAQLSCTCPDEIRRGAGDESEMGAFHDLYQPQRLSALQARAEEYTPAGMNVAVIPVT